MNKRRILNLFLVIAAGVILGKGTKDYYKIEEPIYYRYLVEHYLPTIADSVADTSEIHLKYVKNFDDKREVKRVEFVDHPELKVTMLGFHEEQYKAYKAVEQTMYMEWDRKKMKSFTDEVEISALKVTYSDGSTQNVDIGRIIIYGGESDEQLLEAVSAMPLWEGTRRQEYRTNETIWMEGLSKVSHELLQDHDIVKSYSLKAGKRDITNTACNIKEGEDVVFEMKLNGFTIENFIDSNSDYDYCKIIPKLTYKNNIGKEFTNDIHNYAFMKRFNDYKQVRAYVKERTDRK